MTERPSMNPPTLGEDPLLKAIEGGGNWAKTYIQNFKPAARPLSLLVVAEAVRAKYLELAITPKFTVDSVKKVDGAHYWFVSKSSERVVSSKVFAPSVRVRAVQSKMHFAATLGNARIILHSVLGTAIETLAAHARTSESADVTFEGVEVRPGVYLALSSRPSWQQNIMLVDENDKTKPKTMYNTDHMTVWCRLNGGGWVEVDLCDARGVQVHRHGEGPGEPRINMYDGLVQSRHGAEKYGEGLAGIMDQLVAAAQRVVPAKKKKKKKKKKK